MIQLRRGLFNLSAGRMRTLMGKMTGSPILGLLGGTVVTAVLHSSSAVMVITIGLISAGVLTFRQSIGIILGTNIGTTFTLELITINIDFLIVPFAIFGALLFLIGTESQKNLGKILFGAAAVFASMRGFSFLAGPLSSTEFAGEMLSRLNENVIESIFAGALLTAIIQSSTAMSGIVMGFLADGHMTFLAALAAMLGSNIGTCATGLLASAGAGREARLTAYAHLWLNVGGTILFFPFIDDYALIAPYTAEHADVQLAHASVLFNIVCSFAVLPFTKQFGRFIETLHGKK